MHVCACERDRKSEREKENREEDEGWDIRFIVSDIHQMKYNAVYIFSLHGYSLNKHK